MRKGVQKRKVIAYIMALALVMTSVMPMGNIQAESGETSITETMAVDESGEVSEVITGQCGPNAYFVLDEDKVLRITGEGEIDTKTYTDLSEAGIGDEVVRIAMESGITSVSEEAFMDYTVLETVDFSWKVTSIGEKAFANCTSLKTAIIPKKTSYIANYAFQNCTSIETVYLLANECIVEEYAFEGCNSIKTLLSLVDDISPYNSAFPSKWPESLETIYSLSSDCGANYAYKNNITHIEPTSPIYTGDNSTYRNYVSFEDGLRVVYGGGVVDPISGFNTGSGVAKKIVIVYGMTEIEAEAYSGYSVLESIYIPESVTSIGYSAFNNCSSLKEVILPESLTTIESGWFNDCTSLANIKIPDSVTSIGNSAFKGCKSLTDIKIPDNVTSIGNYVFSGCSALTDISLPENLETIGYAAFENCSELASIQIPNKVSSIESSTFKNCISLTEIKIPGNVTSLGNNAFYGCSALSKVELPNGITYIGDYGFYECTSLVNIDLPDSLGAISKYMFAGCSGLTSIEIPNSLTSIGGYAFKDCTELTEIDIPSSVTTIDAWAFNGCTNITTMKIKNPEVTLTNSRVPENIETIYGYAGSTAETYANENGITFIEIKTGRCGENAYFEFSSDGVLRITGEGEIDTQTYTDLTDTNIISKIESIIIENNITSIGDKAFQNCRNMKSIKLSNSLVSIGDYAFSQTKIEEIDFPESLKEIGGHCFWFSSLIKVELTDNIQKIGDEAFNSCNSLKEVSISCEFTTSNMNLFSQCSELERVEMSNNITSIYPYMFAHCKKLKYIEIPDNLVTIGRNAFYGCESLTNIELPGTLQTIDSSAFAKCTGLTDIEIPSSVTSMMSTFTDSSNITTITIKNPELQLNTFCMPPNLETIYGYRGSTAEKYASENGISFVALDGEGETTPEKIESTTEPVTTTEAETTTEQEKTTEEITTEQETTEEITTEQETTGIAFDFESVNLPSSDGGWKEVTYGDGAADGSKYYIPYDSDVVTVVCELRNDSLKVTYLQSDYCSVTDPVFGFSVHKPVDKVWINGEQLTNSENIFIIRDIIVISQKVFAVEEGQEEIFYVSYSDADGGIYTYPLKVSAKPEETTTRETETPTETEPITLSKEAADNFSYNVYDCYGMADSAVTIDGVTYTDYIHEPGVKASASRNSSSAYQAIDYQRLTIWITENANGNPEYLLIDLGQIRNVKQINILFGQENVQQYTIEVSKDSGHFSIVSLVEENYSSNDRMDEIVFKNMISCRYVKIYCRKSDIGNYGILDVGIYGTELAEEPSVEETPSNQESSINNETTAVSQINNTKQHLGKSKIKKLMEKSHRSVKLTWTKASGATKYAVYRSNKKNGKYKLIKITSKLKYTDKKVKAGKNYFYKIKAINVSGNSTMSKAKKIKVKGTPKTPSIKVSKNSTSWSIVWGTITDNSKGIEIYMQNGQGKYKKYTIINTTTNLKKSKKKKGVTGITSSIGSLQSGVTYKFRARTYAVVKGKKVYSKWSKVKTLKK